MAAAREPRRKVQRAAGGLILCVLQGEEKRLSLEEVTVAGSQVFSPGLGCSRQVWSSEG